MEHVNLLLRQGNAVWALTDNLGCVRPFFSFPSRNCLPCARHKEAKHLDLTPTQTAGDIAFSMNNAEAYEALLAEGVRAEMLRAVLEATAAADDPESDGDEEEEGEPVASTSGTKSGDDDTAMEENGEEQQQQQQKLSTASDNATFLSSRLVFTHDASGQPVALDAEGNGVMMGWETGIMRRTAERLCEDGWADRKASGGGKSWRELVEEEERGEREPLRVMNVGFGLGIVSLSLSLWSQGKTFRHRR